MTHGAPRRLFPLPERALLCALTVLCGCASRHVPAASPGSPPEKEVRAAGPSAAEVTLAREHLDRGKARVDAAQRMRKERSPTPSMGGVFSWPGDAEAYYGYYAQAEEEFAAVLEKFPATPSAAEAQYLMGLINDHPHLNNFERAAEEYGRTVARYPGTAAAGKAAERLRLLEEYLGGSPGPPAASP